MGNSKYHDFVYDTLLEQPGVVVLHDFVLTGFHYWYGLQPQTDAGHFLRELEREQPELAAECRLKGEQWTRRARRNHRGLQSPRRPPQPLGPGSRRRHHRPR